MFKQHQQTIHISKNPSFQIVPEEDTDSPYDWSCSRPGVAVIQHCGLISRLPSTCGVCMFSQALHTYTHQHIQYSDDTWLLNAFPTQMLWKLKRNRWFHQLQCKKTLYGAATSDRAAFMLSVMLNASKALDLLTIESSYSKWLRGEWPNTWCTFWPDDAGSGVRMSSPLFYPMVHIDDLSTQLKACNTRCMIVKAVGNISCMQMTL